MYCPILVRTHYSVLSQSYLAGLTKPEDLVDKLDDLGLNQCCINDHHNIGGSIKFIKALKKSGKKPIVGCDLYIKENENTHHLSVIAKNDIGWKSLLKIISASNSKENFNKIPQIPIDEFSDLCDNLIGFSGHKYSHIDWCIKNSKDCHIKALELQEVFGKGNFYLIGEYTNTETLDSLRDISRITKIPLVASPNSYYLNKEDSKDHLILVCANQRKSLETIKHSNIEFAHNDNFFLPSYQEMCKVFSEQEIEQSLSISNDVEEYKDILHSPIPPRFDCPKGLTAEEYLRELCFKGWKEKVVGIIPKEKEKDYADRVKEELEMFKGMFSDYFLIVWDIVQYMKNNGWLTGSGRGSVGGCLIAYLLGITKVDSIKYGLLLNRFFNKGRLSEDHISLPDIDIDCPKHCRDQLVDYIRQKYGEDNVGQIVTYIPLKAKAAIKEVLSAHNFNFDFVNSITKQLIDDHKISDELEKMKKETGSSSIIMWCLENVGERFKDWVKINNGELEGELAPYFKQAIRLEGTNKAISKHAAGLVITPKPLNEICPMVMDPKTKKQMCGLEMDDIEEIGGIKFDILGLSLLSKLMYVRDDLCGETWE